MPRRSSRRYEARLVREALSPEDKDPDFGNCFWLLLGGADFVPSDGSFRFSRSSVWEFIVRATRMEIALEDGPLGDGGFCLWDEDGG